MPDFTFLILYVQDHDASAKFYNELLDIPVIERKDDFAMLPLRDGVMLGLWARGTVEPKSTSQSGASEVAFTVADTAAIETTHADWQQRGLTILQAPTRMSFGMTFTALDPDGHRLRVFAPDAG